MPCAAMCTWKMGEPSVQLPLQLTQRVWDHVLRYRQEDGIMKGAISARQ